MLLPFSFLRVIFCDYLPPGVWAAKYYINRIIIMSPTKMKMAHRIALISIFPLRVFENRNIWATSFSTENCKKQP